MIYIKDTKKLKKYLFLYRSFIFKFSKFKILDDDYKDFETALNKKKRKERLSFLYYSCCDYVDKYYEGKNLCEFVNNKCLSQQNSKKDLFNGCCRKCRFRTGGVCPTKNLACKMFYCSYVKEKHHILGYDDLPLFKIFTPFQRFVLKSDYFISSEEAINDLYYGPIICPVLIIYRKIKRCITK